MSAADNTLAGGLTPPDYDEYGNEPGQDEATSEEPSEAEREENAGESPLG